jgi:hypothetical protein
MEELARGRPAQDQRGRLRRVEARWHAGQAVGPKRAVGGVRPDHRQIGHAVANLNAAHAIAELIDFPDDIISQHERRPAGCSFPRCVPRCYPCIGAPRKGTVDTSQQFGAVRHRGPLRMLLPVDLAAIGG